MQTAKAAAARNEARRGYISTRSTDTTEPEHPAVVPFSSAVSLISFFFFFFLAFVGFWLTNPYTSSLYGRKYKIQNPFKDSNRLVQPTNRDSCFLIRCGPPAYLVAALPACALFKKKLLGRGYTQDIPLGRPTGPREKKKETVKGKKKNRDGINRTLCSATLRPTT